MAIFRAKLLLLIILISPTILYSQSITVNFNFTSRCSDDTLSIPIATTGTFLPENQFTVNFIGIDGAASFTTNASRVGNKLFVTLPQLISDTKFSDNYALQVESSLPRVSSSITWSRVSISYRTWAKMITTGTGSLNWNTVVSNSHINPGDELKLFVENKGHWDEGLKLRFRGDYTTTSPYISDGIIIKPLKDSTYKLLSVSTANCGNGIIRGNDSLKVSVNPFSLMISQVFPAISCPSQKILVYFSSTGIFGASNQFQMVFQTDGGVTYEIPSITAGNGVITAQIPPNIPAGYYNIRLISSSPIAYSSFGRIKVSPPPSISMSSYPVSLQDSISHGESINLQFGLVGEPLFSIKLNDSLLVTPNYYRNNWASVEVSPKQTTTYTITDFETACGTTNGINVSKTIYVRDEIILDSIPKKYYCQGEIIKMKFRQKGTFAANNQFIVQLKQYNGYIDLSTQVVGDSIFVTIPNQNFDFTYEDGFKLRIKSTSPLIYGSISPNTFFIKRKPKATIQPYISSTSAPDNIPLKIDVSGHRPYSIKLSDGNTYTIPANSFTEMRTQEEALMNVFVSQTTNYSITEVSNDCGLGTFSNSQTIQVLQPNTPTIKFQNSYLYSFFCKGSNYEIPINKAGSFGSNNVFIAEIGHYNNTTRVEIGRSTTNLISATIPTNLNAEHYYLYIKSTNPVVEVVTNVRITNTPSATIQYSFTDLPFEGTPSVDTIKILKNEKVRFGINFQSASGPYNIGFSNGKIFNPLLNSAGNPYVNTETQAVTFSFSNSQQFNIAQIANSCGTGSVIGSGRYISVVPLRITPKIRYTDFETTVCEGNNFFVPYEVDGVLPTNAVLAVQLAKQNTTNFIELPLIEQKNPIEVKIPLGFEEGYYSIRVICKNCPSGKYNNTNSVRIRKLASASLKLQNNLDTLTINGGQTVQLKLSLIGTPEFRASLNDGSQYNISTNEQLISKTPFTSQTFRLSALNNTCGYATNNDSVRIKVRNKLSFYVDNTTICRNKSFNVNYQIYGDYAANNTTKFSLVSSTGTNWDLLTIINNNGTASLQIPSNVPLGAYSLRLSTTFPAFNYSTTINIIDVPVVELQGNTTVVEGEKAYLRVKIIEPTTWQTANYIMSDGLTDLLGGVSSGFGTVTTKPTTISSTYFIQKISNSCGIGSSTGNSVVTVIPKSNTHSIQLNYIDNRACKGAIAQIYFSKTGNFGANNTFKLLFSDKNGNNFTEIPATYNPAQSTINYIVPPNLELGNNYRLLIKSTEPEVSSSSSLAMSMFDSPRVSFVDTVYFVPTNGTLTLKVQTNANSFTNNIVYVTLNNSSSSTGIIGNTGTIIFSGVAYKYQTFKITNVSNSNCPTGIIENPSTAKVCNESLSFNSYYGYSGFNGAYQTEKTITVSSNFNNSNVNLNAGSSVTLLPGFKFSPTTNYNGVSTQFTAKIDGCFRN